MSVVDRVKYEKSTYSLEVAMNHVAGMEIAQTLDEVEQLAAGVSAGKHDEGDTGTHETKSIRSWIVLNVSRQIPTRHPIRDELERGDGDTPKG